MTEDSRREDCTLRVTQGPVKDRGSWVGGESLRNGVPGHCIVAMGGPCGLPGWKAKCTGPCLGTHCVSNPPCVHLRGSAAVPGAAEHPALLWVCSFF